MTANENPAAPAPGAGHEQAPQDHERRPVAPLPGGPLTKAATVLGMEPAEVFAALQNGQSLLGLAGARGMTHDELIAGIKDGLPAGLPHLDDAAAMLEVLVARKGLGVPGDPGGDPAAEEPWD